MHKVASQKLALALFDAHDDHGTIETVTFACAGLRVCEFWLVRAYPRLRTCSMRICISVFEDSGSVAKIATGNGACEFVERERALMREIVRVGPRTLGTGA